MIIQKLPVFQEGTVLTQEMLEALKQYAYNTGVFPYLGYANGILKGCGITAYGDRLIVREGMLLYEGEIFYFPHASGIEYEPTDSVKLLAARVGDRERSRSLETRTVELRLTSEADKTASEIELCRYRLQPGARLRCEYRNFSDMDTEYDTVNVCHAGWSAYGGPSVSYEILYQFANAAQTKRGLSAEDRMFLGQIFAAPGETLPKACICNYLSGRLQKDCREDSIHDLYLHLVDVLRQMDDTRGAAGQKAQSGRRMIVD